MMRRSRFGVGMGLVFGLALVPWTCVLNARAEAIRPWNGATASVDFLGEKQNTSGPNATSTLNKTKTLQYKRVGYWEGPPATTEVTGRTVASASGAPDALLFVQSGYSGGPNRGDTLQPVGPGGLKASASWTNDSLTIKPPDGTSMPSSVKLLFDLNTSVPRESYYGSVTLSIQGESARITEHSMDTLGAFSQWVVLPSKPLPIEVETGRPVRGIGSRFHGSFSVDLPIDEFGKSSSIDLGLSSYLTTSAAYANEVFAALALKDILLPDGASLISKGYEASFESGLNWPSPVPEPSSVACWALATVALGWALRRRSQAC